MSLKDLFADTKKNSAKPIIKKSIEDLNKSGGDSNLNIEEFNYRKNEYEPFVDYTTASNFAHYGSAEEYFDSAIKRIYQEFPYDGSTYEVNKWLNYSNGIDRFIYENEYPRSNGHARFSPVSFGGVNRLANTYYSVPATKEFILFKGGPNKDNLWDSNKKLTSNLEINGTNGNTVEFWLKKDAFNASFPREVVFDVWRSGSIQGVESSYGRFTIELDRANKQLNKSPFLLTYKSGSTGFNQQILGTSQVALSASDGKWHHYAISVKSNSENNETIAKLYVDGNINDSRAFNGTVSSINNSLVASIGSLVAAKSATSGDSDPSYLTNNNLGFGKLSASLDDFRYWKVERTSKEIGSNWFTSIRGGSNTKEGNNALGVYYKFNEGITQEARIDSNVLDYSGRVTNGLWYGYRDTSRSIRSAIVQSSASLSEYKDPILYTENPKLQSYINEKKELGRDHDINNSTCLYYSLPSWITEEENFEGELKSLVQIIGSYFDTLYMQIQDLSKLSHIRYEDYKKKPNPFMKKILKSFGLDVPELFVDTDVLSVIANKSDEIVYEQKINDVKNLIYTNLYNNLSHIYKVKGTESAFRNVMRCYGIDEKLLTLKIYSDNVEYESFDQFIQETVKDKMIDFSKEINQGGIIFQQSSSFNNDSDFGFASYNYVSGTHDNLTVDLATTTEINVNFPALLPYYSEHRIVRPLSSSLFGAYTDSDSTDNKNGFKNAAKDYSGFNVYAVKESDTSPNTKFVLTSRSELLPHIETDFIKNVYADTNWNISVRVSPHKFGPLVSGAIGNSYNVEFYGVSSVGDNIQKRFEVSRPFTRANGLKFQKHSKRFYVGATRLNFTGSLITKADSKISSFRHWLTRLGNKDLDGHILERKSSGISDPFKVNSNLIGSGSTHLRNIDSLAVHWEFDNVTGSDTNGQFIVDDISSGSVNKVSSLAEIAASYHPARGFKFQQGTDNFVINEFVSTNRKVPMGELRSSDLINIKTKKDDLFPEKTRPSNHYFTIEKGLYDVISREMLNVFSSIKEYTALVGDPINRYRSNYKSLDKLKEIFFAKVQNKPSVERFLEFYKWIDKSIDAVLDQFIPATSNFSDDIKNVIESHAFERSKYKTQFPTIDTKASEPIASLTGINELRYNWESGHAPIPDANGVVSEADNCLWWNDRIERNDPLVSTGDANVDRVREDLRKRINSVVSGSTYSQKRLTRPYKLSADFQVPIHAGDNFHLNKKKDFYIGTTRPLSTDFIQVSSSNSNNVEICNTIRPPDAGGGVPKSLLYYEGNERTIKNKRRLYFKADISHTNNDYSANHILPFVFYSSSVESPTDYKNIIKQRFRGNVDITNLHSDSYGDDREIPIQGPFTQHFVGGHHHRHVPLNRSGSFAIHGGRKQKIGKETPEGLKTGLDAEGDRREAFFIRMNDGELLVVNPDAQLTSSADGSSYRYFVPKPEASANSLNVLREPLAKRPVNIRNIQTTTGSLYQGNYQRDYEILQGSGVEINKGWLVENHNNRYKVDQPRPDLSGSSVNWKKVDNEKIKIEVGIEQEFSSSYFRGRKHKVRPDRSTGKKNFIINRFSSPGGPETAGDAHGGSELDVATTQYSIYNTLNYRNLPIRLGLDALQSERRLKFGTAPIKEITEETEYDSFAASTLVTVTNTSTQGETIILEDAFGRTATLTTSTYANWGGNGGQDPTTGRTRVKWTSNASAAGYLVYYINKLRETGYLDLHAFRDPDNSSRLRIIMGNGSGTAGNDKVIAGTAVSNNRLTANAFSGGTPSYEGYLQTRVTASYHNVHRNTRYYPSDISKDLTSEKNDNFFVQRQIPQSDLNYAWIKNRTIETKSSYFGYQNTHFTYPVGDGTTEIGYFESPRFVSASEIGFAKHTEPASYGDHYFIVDVSSALDKALVGSSGYTQFIHTDFVGLNSVVLDNVDFKNNLLGYSPETGYAPRLRMFVDGLPLDTNTFTLTDHAGVFKKYIFDSNETTADGTSFKARGSIKFNFNAGESGPIGDITLVTTGGVSITFFLTTGGDSTGTNVGGKIAINISGLTLTTEADFKTMVTRIKDAINNSTYGHGGAAGIEALTPVHANNAAGNYANTTLPLRQKVAGAAGNTAVGPTIAVDTDTMGGLYTNIPSLPKAVATDFADGGGIVIGLSGIVDNAFSGYFVLLRVQTAVNGSGFGILATDKFPDAFLPYATTLEQTRKASSGVTKVDSITTGTNSESKNILRFVGIDQDGSEGTANQFGVATNGVEDDFLSGISYNATDQTSTGSQKQININYLNEELANHGPNKSDSFLDTDASSVKIEGTPLILNAVLSNRGDCWGWVPWRQLRVQDHKLVRLQRKRNIYTTPVPRSETIQKLIDDYQGGILDTFHFSDAAMPFYESLYYSEAGVLDQDKLPLASKLKDRVRGTVGYSWPDNIEIKDSILKTAFEIKDKVESHTIDIEADYAGTMRKNTRTYEHNSYITQSVVTSHHHPVFVKRLVGYKNNRERTAESVDLMLNIRGNFFLLNSYVYKPGVDTSRANYYKSDTRAFSFGNKYEYFTKEKAFMLYYNNEKNFQTLQRIKAFDFPALIGDSSENQATFRSIRSDFRSPDEVEDYSIVYKSTLYPKDFYAYNRDVILRPKFIFNDWRQARSERTAPSDYQNSQFVSDENIKFSVWPLDAQPNFAKQKEMALGKDNVGSFSEGELMSTIGLYRSGSNNPYSVSGSAMYSRRSPETTIEHSFEFTDPSKLDTAATAVDTAHYFAVIRDQDIEERYLLALNTIDAQQIDGTGLALDSRVNLSNFEMPYKGINLRLGDDVTNLSDYVASADNQYAVNLNRVFNATVGGKVFRISSSPQEGTIDITDIDRSFAPVTHENQATFVFDGSVDTHDGTRDALNRIIIGTQGITNTTLEDGTVTFSTNEDADEFVQRFRLAFIGSREAGFHIVRVSEVTTNKGGNLSNTTIYKREIKIYNAGTITKTSIPEIQIIDSKWRSHIDPNNINKVIFKYFGTYETNNFGVPPLIQDTGTQNLLTGFDNSLIAVLDFAGSGDHGFIHKSNTKTHIGGAAEWEVAKSYGVSPFNYKDYDEFIENLKLTAKDYSVIPEFKISDNIDVLKNIDGNDKEQFIDPFIDNELETPKNFYSITGALEDFKDSSNNDFARAFNSTDIDNKLSFVNYVSPGFGTGENHRFATIKVKAYKKFLPYDGFYPVQRTLQLAKLFNEEYQPLMNQNPLGSWQTALKPMFAPGIMYNTIKSGLAVDYPLFVPSSDREFNRFCTRFGGATANRVEIGSAGTWAKYFTGSLAPRTQNKNLFGTGSTGQQRLTGSAGYTNAIDMQDTGSLKGITLSMWIHPYNDSSNPYPTNYSNSNYWANDKATLDSGSLIMFGDDYDFHNTNNGRGIEFRKEGDRLVFGIHHTSSHVVFHSKNTGTDTLPGLTAFAEGSLTFAPAMTSMYDGGTFTLINTRGVTKRYIFDDDNQLGANGSANGDDCVIQINGLDLTGTPADMDTLIARVAAAINGANGHNGTITATTVDASDKVELVQVVGGQSGNTAITFTNGLESFVTKVDFSNGGFDTITLNTDGNNYMKPGSWHHVAVSYQWGQNFCDFYVDGFHVSSSVSSSSGVTIGSYPINAHMFGGDDGDPHHAGVSLLVDNYKGGSVSSTPKSNCTIGNHKAQYARFIAAGSAVRDASDGDGKERPNYLRYLPMSVDIDEVTIWNKPLTAIDVAGLNGGGISGSRGPWNPELCVRGDDSKDSLIGWFRMGDDFGYVGDIKAGVASPGAGETPAHNTNNLVMFNRARPNNRRFRKKAVTSTESTRQPTTAVTGTFVGFTDNFSDPGNVDTDHLRNRNDNNNPRFYQRGSGIKDVVELMSYDSVNPKDRLALTGALQYPSYITGSWFNETQDTGIPRIGSASWGVNRQFPYGRETAPGTISLIPDHPNASFDGNYLLNPDRDSNGTVARGTQNFWGRGTRHLRGIRKADRLPFESIIDPKRFFFTNEKIEEPNRGEVHRFVIHEVEPHPSASLNSHSWTRHRLGQKFLGKPDSLIHSASWNTPTTSSMITSSFDMDRLEEKNQSILSDRYSLAANNFFAETMNFFLLGGQTARIISSEFPQDPRIVAGTPYKMRIRLETLRKNTDFPMYNRADAFGPPVDAGDAAFEHTTFEDPPTNVNTPIRMSTWGYSPFTPPHYDGLAEIEYTFTPNEGDVYPNIEDILDDIGVEDIKFNRNTNITGSSPLLPSFGGATNSHFSSTVATSSLNKLHAMQITASFRGLDLAKGKKVLLDQVDDGSEEITRFRNAFVVESKFECPTFDFTGVSGSSPSPESLQKTIGMWHQKPSSINSNTVLRIMSPIEFGENPEEVKDLSQLLGLKMIKGGVAIRNKRIKLGELNNSKQVSEAVVMIPYIDTPNGPRYFLAPEAEVYRAVQNRYYFYQNDYRFAYKTLTGELLPEPSEIVENMVDGMMNYIIPPEFNSIKYNGSSYSDFRKVKPYLMFFFPFTHNFDQQDLARMWQGVMPKFGENFNKSPGFLFDQNQPNPDLNQAGNLETNFEELQLSLPLSELEQFGLEGSDNQTVKRIRITRRTEDNIIVGADRVTIAAELGETTLTAEEAQELQERERARASRRRRRARFYNFDTTRNVFDVTLGTPEAASENLSNLFDRVKFRIFKVKKRAENNYFRKQALDTVRLFTTNLRESEESQEFGRPFETIFNRRQSDIDVEFSVEKDLLSYGYNWPYDYFSMIELVKIEAEHEFMADRLTPKAAENAFEMFKRIENDGEE